MYEVSVVICFPKEDNQWMRVVSYDKENKTVTLEKNTLKRKKRAMLFPTEKQIRDFFVFCLENKETIQYRWRNKKTMSMRFISFCPRYLELSIPFDY